MPVADARPSCTSTEPHGRTVPETGGQFWFFCPFILMMSNIPSISLWLLQQCLIIAFFVCELPRSFSYMDTFSHDQNNYPQQTIQWLPCVWWRHATNEFYLPASSISSKLSLAASWIIKHLWYNQRSYKIKKEEEESLCREGLEPDQFFVSRDVFFSPDYTACYHDNKLKYIQFT